MNMTIEKPLILQIEDMIGKDYLYMGKEVTIESAYVQRGENLIIKFVGEEKPLTFYFDDFRHIRDTRFKEITKKPASRAKKCPKFSEYPWE